MPPAHTILIPDHTNWSPHTLRSVSTCQDTPLSWFNGVDSAKSFVGRSESRADIHRDPWIQSAKRAAECLKASSIRRNFFASCSAPQNRNSMPSLFMQLRQGSERILDLSNSRSVFRIEIGGFPTQEFLPPDMSSARPRSDRVRRKGIKEAKMTSKTTFAQILKHVHRRDMALLKDRAFGANKIAKLTTGRSRRAAYRVKDHAITRLLALGEAQVLRLNHQPVGVRFRSGGQLHLRAAAHLNGPGRNAARNAAARSQFKTYRSATGGTL